MSRSASYNPSDNAHSGPGSSYDANPPTTAAFSPTSTSGYYASSKSRSTIIVHKKSPLLVATPPQVTRALAHSHPFLLPLNKLVGLLSWSTEDPWESFLFVAAFWGITLYGSYILQYGGPILIVTALILGMYSRRYSPLSSTSATGEKHDSKTHKRQLSEPSSSSPQHKSLDEILETLSEFTARCNILLEPFLTLTDFLSTQRTATSATTRPALTTLFIRILLVTPLWILMTLPPLYILTPKRVILAAGTIVLSWHSRPARITRVILWRSVFLRRIGSVVTGLQFPTPDKSTTSLLRPPHPLRRKSQANLASEVATKSRSPGVRFTFILYENQRRWIGLGWTTSLFAYERSPWTDEHLNPAPSRDEFELPQVEGGIARWRWVKGSEWKIDGGDANQHKRSGSKTGPTGTTTKSSPNKERAVDGGGWIYYDNKWDEGRREDGWGRYTRRRKWYRDAELVEVTGSMTPSPAATPAPPIASDNEDERLRKAREYGQRLSPKTGNFETESNDLADSVATIVPASLPAHNRSLSSTTGREDDIAGTKSTKRRPGWFGRRHTDDKVPTSGRQRSDSKSSVATKDSVVAKSERSNASSTRDGPEEDVHDRWRDSGKGPQERINIGEEVVMGLG